VTIRRLILPLTLAMIAVNAAAARAQGAFPAPLPGAASRPASDPAFPPVNGAAPSAMIGGASPFPSAGAPPVSGGFAPPQQAGPPGGDECMNGFLPLRQEAEKRGLLIKKASEKHAPAEEFCKLFASFSVSELNMIKYIDSHAQKCGIPPNVGQQLKTGHQHTEQMQKQACAAAQQQAKGPAGPTLSDVLGSAALPEATAAKRSGGSTFDTLQGNALAR
jgi:hypothetical protein